MPKELIHDRNSDPSATTASVELTWGREPSGYVQLGAIMREAITGVTETGIYVQLDRSGLNRLIRTLRRSRDAAFGADA